MNNNNKQDSASNKSRSNSSSSRERNDETLNMQIQDQNDGLAHLMNNFNLSPLSQASGRLPVVMPRLQGEEPLNTADWRNRLVDEALAIVQADLLDGNLPNNDESQEGPQER